MSHLDDCSEYLQGLSKAGDGKLPLAETLDQFMKRIITCNRKSTIVMMRKKKNMMKKIKWKMEPEASNDAEKTLTDYVKLSKRVSMTEEKQRQKEIEGIKEKILIRFMKQLVIHITCSQLILTAKLFPSTYPELCTSDAKLFGRLADPERYTPF